MSQSKKPEATTSKLWGGRFVEPTDAFVQRFTASEAFDRRLATQDIRGSLAHASMLCAQNILSQGELAEIELGQQQISEKIHQKSFAMRC